MPDERPQSKAVRAAEIIVRAADMTRELGGEPFMGLAAIDPETGRWRTIYRGLTIGMGPVSPDGRYLAFSQRTLENNVWLLENF